MVCRLSLNPCFDLQLLSKGKTTAAWLLVLAWYKPDYVPSSSTRCIRRLRLPSVAYRQRQRTGSLVASPGDLRLSMYTALRGPWPPAASACPTATTTASAAEAVAAAPAVASPAGAAILPAAVSAIAVTASLPLAYRRIQLSSAPTS